MVICRMRFFRFRVTTWAEPNHYYGWYNLGCCYLARGQKAKAMGALRRALQIHPKSQDARFMLFAVDAKALPQDQMPAAMPEELVLNQFNVDPLGYERLQNEAGYQAAKLLGNAVLRELDPNRQDYTMLDLGCGTGLVGLALRHKMRLIMGVDLSPIMTEHTASLINANGGKLYDDVRHADLRLFLSQITVPSYDVVTAAHVFGYVGDLSGIFDHVFRALRSSGVFRVHYRNS